MKYFGFILLILLNFSCKKQDNPPDPPLPDPEVEFMRGADLSFLPEIETYGVTFYDSTGLPKDMLTIFSEAGCNTVRIRLWHTPATKHSGLGEVIEFSQRIRAAGMKVYLTLHYSDTWADPGKQYTPAAWAGLTLAQLQDSVYDYTERVVSLIKPDYVSLGNEINGGMLWETGRIDNGDNLFRLLGRASQATRNASPSTRIIIHFAGFNGSDWFFGLMETNHVDYDIAGISYYPIWHGKDLDALKSAVSKLALQSGKPVLIAETAYPFTLGWADWTHNIVGLEDQLVPGFPATPQGQQDFLASINDILLSVDSSAGYCYWGAEFVAFKGPQALDGSPWENQAMFDFNYQALPAMKIFQE